MASVPDRSAKVPAQIALLCLIWGSTWWAIRICVAVQPPLTSAALRFAVASLLMAALTPLLRRREAAAPPPAWLWLLAGATNFAGSYGVLYVAEQHVRSGTAAVLWAIFPLLMALSGVLVLGERLSPRQLLGFVICFGGICTVSANDLGGDELHWALLLLVSPVVSAIGTTLVKRHGRHTSSVLLNRNGMLLGAAMLGAAAFVAERPLELRWTWPAAAATLYLALVGTTLAFGLYFHLLRTTAASSLSLITYVTPVLAMLLAAIVGDGALTPLALTGTTLVAAGLFLVVGRRR